MTKFLIKKKGETSTLFLQLSNEHEDETAPQSLYLEITGKVNPA